MKRTVIVVVLVLALTFAFAASASATTGKFFKGGVDYYTWSNPSGSPAPGTAWIASGVSSVGSNTVQPGAHANYLATTAKCGICHSVHRAVGDGTKLLPTADATCSGCHTGGTAITAKIITVGTLNTAWREGDAKEDEFANDGYGPHNDGLYTLYDDGEWDGISTPPSPSFAIEPFSRYGCATRRCHATNPHGANSSKYKIFAAKLLFNNSPADDAAEEGTTTVGSYGGDDAVYNALGATDASVQRFIDANVGLVRAALTTTAGVEINKDGTGWRQPDPAETHALVAGLTCGRPSVGDDGIGNDECHAEASYAIFDKDVKENRNHGTKISGNDGSGPAPLIPVEEGSLETTINKNAYRTDNTGAEYNADGVWYSGGNGNRDSKTGHVAGSFEATGTHGSYAPIAGCTSCHDQTDSANTVAGHFTFPHGQTPQGTTNATAVDGSTGTLVRSRIWSGWSGAVGETKKVTDSTSKAYDGQCLKCHRDTGGLVGIGKTK